MKILGGGFSLFDRDAQSRTDRRSLNMQPRRRRQVLSGVTVTVTGRVVPHQLGRIPTTVTVEPRSDTGDTWKLTRRSSVDRIWIQADSTEFVADITIEG